MNSKLLSMQSRALRLNVIPGVSHGNVLWTGLLWNRLHGWHWHSGALISTSDQFTKTWLGAYANPDPTCAAMVVQKNGDWIKIDCRGRTHQYICEYP